MNKLNNTMWGFSRATAAERRLGRFLRSDEGHADAAAADADGAAAAAATDDAAGATDDGAVDKAADTAAEQAGGDDAEGTVIGDAKAPGQADPKDGEAAEGDADKDGDAEDVKPYDGLVPPEGFEALDADALAAATPLMRKFGVADDQAQDFINEAAPVIKSMIERGLAAAQEAQRQNHAEIERGWVAEMQSHPEFGGQNFEQSKTFVARALDSYFPAEFRQFLNESRLGQHPAMFEGLVKIGKEIAEDTVDIPGAAGQRGRGHPVYDDLFLPPEQRG